MKVCEIARIIEAFAPQHLAEHWDNVGLQIGDPVAQVSKVLVALTVTAEVITEAVKKGATLIVAHHPLIHEPMKAITQETLQGQLAGEIIRQQIALYCAHTNLDAAEMGVNAALAEAVGIKDARPLVPITDSGMKKFVVFVPETDLEKVRRAICEAGAGIIGEYRDCTYRVSGVGTFTPLESADPTIGERGKFEEVDEYRLETIVPSAKVWAVLEAMRLAHSYEEPAFDVYPLNDYSAKTGMGRYGKLASPCTLEEFAQTVKSALDIDGCLVVGDPQKKISTAAVGGGSGGDLVAPAAALGCDVLLTGEMKYHTRLETAHIGLAAIVAGHAETERLVIPKLAKMLQSRIDGIEVIVSEADASPTGQWV